MFDWEDYYKLARLLCESKSADLSGVEDARFRSAASRAYFSTYCLARNMARHYLSFNSDLRANHAALIAFYKNARDQKLQQIGLWLERLRGWRNKCDYDDRVENVAKLAELSLHVAQRIINSLNQIQAALYH